MVYKSVTKIIIIITILQLQGENNVIFFKMLGRKANVIFDKRHGKINFRRKCSIYTYLSSIFRKFLQLVKVSIPCSVSLSALFKFNTSKL